MKKRILCLGLALLLCGALAAPPAALAVRMPDTPAPNCHEMAELWFGASLMTAADPDSPDAAASLWFAQREADYLGTGAVVLSDAVYLQDAETGGEDPSGVEVPAGEAAAQDRIARLAAIAAMQERLGIAVTDADVTPLVDSSRTRFNPDGTVTLYVYEWTFLDYDDLSDGPGGTDVMGCGVWHKLTMEPLGDSWRTVRDEYDETDFLGVDTITEGTRSDPEAAFLCEADSEGDALLNEAEQEENEATQSPVFYPGYDPDAAAAYADRYAMSYNPAFPNYNPVGGDCANFTSQCIYAGGMPMVRSSSGWYHRLNSTSTNSDRSSSWTFARGLYDWMGANRGIAMTASDSTVLKGSPVFYVNRGRTTVGHAVICVGTNSAGRPIIDGHNNDVYHAVWNYSKSAPAVYTVQLTGTSDLPLSIVGERYPQGLVGQGFSFGLRGIIRSNEIVTQVSADVLNSAGVSVLRYRTDWNDYQYDIQHDGLNDSLVFENLTTGTYTYVVQARDASGVERTLIESSFTVAGSELSITGESKPSGTLRRGDSFRLTGVISSNFPITQVSAFLYGGGDTPVLQYERNWNSTSYNIRRDGLNSAFVFNNLLVGSYVYSVSATDASGTTRELIHAPFTVTDLPAAPAVPVVQVNGRQVTLSWSGVYGAEYYEAALTPLDPEGYTYSQTTERTSAAFESVRPGTYQASVSVCLAGESLQSETAEAAVLASAGLSLSTSGARFSGQQITIPVTVSNGGAAAQGCVAAALYQGERMVECNISNGISIPASSMAPLTAFLPCGAELYQAGNLTAKLFLLSDACAVTDTLLVEI